MKKIVAAISLSVALLLSFRPLQAQEAKWVGVDESVVEKFASEHGREAMEPLINTDQGDLLLFLFLLAGAVGGFVAGYMWRSLLEGGKAGGRPAGSKV
ncbi:MAG: cobalt ABC transporter permease [Desulfatiglandales bacterium]